MFYSLTSLLCFVLYLNKVFAAGEDNLRNALNSIKNRQKQLATSYHSLPPNKDFGRALPFDDESIMYLGNSPVEDETPHYGHYSRPNPPAKHFRTYEDEDVVDDSNTDYYQKALKERLVEQLVLDVLNNEKEQQPHRSPQKKSFFREREINEILDNLQNLQSEPKTDEDSLVERIRSKLRSATRKLPNVNSNDGDAEDFEDNYLNFVNPSWRKYDDHQSVHQNDPELLTNDEMDGFLKYLESKHLRDNEEYIPNEYYNTERDRSKRYWLGSNDRNLIRKRSAGTEGKPIFNERNNATSFNETRTELPQTTRNPPITVSIKTNTEGQKEVPVDLKTSKPVNIEKKSIDWSNYFGVDKRGKKSDNVPKHPSPKNDDVLLDQYIQSYILQSVRNSAFNNRGNNYGYYPKRSERSRNEKQFIDDASRETETEEDLRTAEDMIIDRVLKYTGAQQGMNDHRQLPKFRKNVIDELAAAYNLEELRNEIFKEHKLSEAKVDRQLKKPYDHSHMKRVAMKKDNPEFIPGMETMKLKHNFTALGNSLKTSSQSINYHYGSNNATSLNEACLILNDIMEHCQQITSNTVNTNGEDSPFTPFCTLHHICNICGTKEDSLFCDLSFSSDIKLICADEDALCRYKAQRILSALQSEQTNSFLNRYACDPCIADILQYSYEK